jgi:hypothetical protein
MKDKPVDVDLDSLWTQLGIQSHRASVRFDESATLAAIRRTLTTALESNAVAEGSAPLGPTAVFAGCAVGPS